MILTSEEVDLANSLTSFSSSSLVYRASDIYNGFASQTYYAALSGKSNLITIFKSGSYVFGAYISIKWPYPSIAWQTDSNAFLFSLRRNGTSNSVKLPIVESSYAFYSNYNDFVGYYGRASDLVICNQPFVNSGYIISYSQLGLSYTLPSGCTFNTPCAQTFLAGKYQSWYVDDFETYQLS